MPTEPSWWRSQYWMLKTWKTETAAIMKWYTVPFSNNLEEIARHYNDTTNAWFWTKGLPDPRKDQMFYSQTATGTLATLKLPTNFFNYTPWRCLNENGPFTNDAGVVGRGHGWTNEYTAAGGTNFPDGRTAWYTTDYGWNGLRRVISALTTTEIHCQWDLGSDSVTNYIWIEAYSTNYATAQGEVASALSSGSFSWSQNIRFLFPMAKTYNDDNYAGMYRTWNHARVLHSPVAEYTNGLGASFLAYAMVGPTNETDTHLGITELEWEFNDQGLGYTPQMPTLIGSGTFASTDYAPIVATIGQSDVFYSTVPEWCVEDPWNGDSYTQAGYIFGDSLTTLATWQFAYTNEISD